jgi:hypothetical protein
MHMIYIREVTYYVEDKLYTYIYPLAYKTKLLLVFNIGWALYDWQRYCTAYMVRAV